MSSSEPLSIRQLAVFVALVEQGSFTRAARHLGLSQSTVSGHIADLERRLGIRLVGRERSGVLPTGAGEALLGPCRQALRAEAHARMTAAELVGLVRGDLRVGASTIPADYLLPPLLATFRTAHPDIELYVQTGDSDEVLTQVTDGDVDVGVIGAKPSRKGIESYPLGRDRLVLIMAPGHPFASRKRLGLESILDQPFVVREVGSGTQRAIDEALSEASDGARLMVVARLGSTSAIKMAVRAGLGLAFVSERATEDEVAAGTLVRSGVAGLDLQRNFHLISRRREETAPAARAFLELALKTMRA